MERLNDKSLMPFGKYSGTPMANVPADYLLWMHRTIKNIPVKVKDYITENLEVLEKEVEQVKK